MPDRKIKPQHHPAKSSFRFPLSVCLFVPSCLSGQDPRSTLVETRLQIHLFFAKQTQFQNGQYKHKYSNSKGLCQRTTNNEHQTLPKTNPIQTQSPRLFPSRVPARAQENSSKCPADAHVSLKSYLSTGESPAESGSHLAARSMSLLKQLAARCADPLRDTVKLI